MRIVVMFVCLILFSSCANYNGINTGISQEWVVVPVNEMGFSVELPKGSEHKIIKYSDDNKCFSVSIDKISRGLFDDNLAICDVRIKLLSKEFFIESYEIGNRRGDFFLEESARFHDNIEKMVLGNNYYLYRKDFVVDEKSILKITVELFDFGDAKRLNDNEIATKRIINSIVLLNKYDARGAALEVEKIKLATKEQASETEEEQAQRYREEIAEEQAWEAKQRETLRLNRKAEDRPLPDKNVLSRKVSLGNGVAMELVGCNAGTFTMGSPIKEKGRNKDEIRHLVTISRPFGIGKTEVTQAQWQAVMGSNPSNFKGDDLPVEQVSWGDAITFCKKLNEREISRLPDGYEYRLPTEAEWEYACRGGSSPVSRGPYSGTGWLDEMGWYNQNSRFSTHPVAQKQPNAWGLYDMHGNVCEWCHDWYGSYPTSPGTDPTGPATGVYRVNRGGNWLVVANYCRAAQRNWSDPSERSFILGFRVVLAFAVHQ